MGNKSVFVLLVLIILLTANLALAVVMYNITDLGTLDGYEMSVAWFINNNGQIVGWVQDPGSLTQRAVLFDATGGGNNIDLGTLGGENSSAVSINNKGQIVGGAENDASPPIFCATLFDPDGGGNNTGLGKGSASSINDNGQIVGYIGTVMDSRAVLFDPTGQGINTDLGTLDGYLYSVAYSMNNSRVIVGYSYNDPYPSTGDFRATLFDPNGQGNNIDLGTLGGEVSFALSINNNGQIVGGGDIASGDRHAILFDSTGDGNNLDLGTLGEFFSSAISINDNGQIVGQAFVYEPFPQYSAVLFDPTGGGNNIKLEDLIHPGIGWKFGSARCINDNGWIVGSGTNPNGDSRAFLLMPATLGDFEPDRDVDLKDFAVFAAAWQSREGEPNWNVFCDISSPEDGVVNELDLAIFCSNWLAQQ